MTAQTQVIGPSKQAAAHFLRELAGKVGQKVGNPAQRAADFRLLADCIEGKAKWGKPRTRRIHELQRIDFFAFMVEHRRPEGMSVTRALDLHADNLARELRLRGPNAPDQARDLIVEARKRLRKAERSSAGR